ncbi:short-chain dehydrogenase [Streptomyces mashuensis]|uniref:Short-chain dehydrogenase n=1 Tax=Streptomyces mashuensis TaxID=33904 RepID=A0A919B6P3_9ACTN|nr:short-chain dehydrogenase [Streptomyces mashuensis]
MVVVTGASGGVGRATARAFAARGACVALLARGEAGLEAAAEEVESRGGRALPLSVDMADPHAVTAAADRIEEILGPVDVWINNAFSGVFAPFVEIEPEEFRRVTEVTYLGYAYGTRAALTRMLPRDHGTIVQVGSALAYRGIPLQSAYCGAKHAIQGMNESLRCELLHLRSKVRTTMVQLPAVNTPQFDWVLNRLPRRPRPVAPVYEPEVAARAIVHAAAHPRRREYWVGGSTVATLLANAVVPGLLDRYLARTGFDAQQRPERERDLPPVNLWHAVDGDGGRDFGAHGEFGYQAHAHGTQPWLSRHRAGVAAGAAVAAAAAVIRGRMDHHGRPHGR